MFIPEHLSSLQGSSITFHCSVIQLARSLTLVATLMGLKISMTTAIHLGLVEPVVQVIVPVFSYRVNAPWEYTRQSQQGSRHSNLLGIRRVDRRSAQISRAQSQHLNRHPGRLRVSRLRYHLSTRQQTLLSFLRHSRLLIPHQNRVAYRLLFPAPSLHSFRHPSHLHHLL